MKNDIAISVKNLSKQYKIGSRDPYVTLRDVLSNPFAKREEKNTFWALKDVSFDVKQGEVVGVIGKNGSGKSTLLKILTRITPPTKGEAIIKGRVASLLEVGTGFNAELTGRENIFLNGAILGMTQKEIKRKFDEIVDFSGVEKFLDTPVKRYSSGMYVRLAFAVAAHLESEILLVDEVLAVGDAEFRKKSLDKMDSISKSQDTTILVVTHNPELVSNLCNRAILLNNGRIKSIGNTTSILKNYLNQNKVGSNSIKYQEKDFEAFFKEVIVSSHNKTSISIDDPIQIDIYYQINKPISPFQVVCHIWNIEGVHVLSTADVDVTNIKPGDQRLPGLYKAVVTIPPMILAPNTYQIKLACGIPNVTGIDVQEGPYFEIISNEGFVKDWSAARKSSILSLPLKWNINKL